MVCIHMNVPPACRFDEVKIHADSCCLDKVLCCSAREVQLSALSPVLCQMASTAIPIPGLSPCNPAPPTQHASGGTLPASESGLQAESAGASEPPYQISSADLVTVSSFKPSVHVMSTKTRPKRIGIVGSDGRTYTFLLKVPCSLILSAC